MHTFQNEIACSMENGVEEAKSRGMIKELRFHEGSWIICEMQ